MDMALRNDDLIREIFSHLRTPAREAFWDINTGTLYSAALACKRFSSHALDALWFSSCDLDPLMSLIPNSKKTLHGAIYLTEPVRKEGLQTFERYAKRIKEYYEYPPNVDISTRIRVPVMLDLLQCLNRHFLLPNLRWLHIESLQVEEESPDFGCYLLCPTLQHLQATFYDVDHLAFTLPRIIQLAPHLRSLDLDETPIPDDQLPLISRLSSLQELSTENDFVISLETFSQEFSFASQLKVWRAGTISIGHESTDLLSSFHRVRPPTPQFPLLTELKLYKPQMIQTIAEVFDHGLFPKLETLVLYVYPLTNARNLGWEKLFLALFRQENSIQYLGIQLPPGLDSVSFLVDFDDNDVFRLLEGCDQQNLTILNLNAHVVESLPTSSIRIMVKTFPYLKEIDINVSTTEYILFTDLGLIARGLSHLISLKIGVLEDSDISPITTIPILSHRLQYLCLYNSDIEDPLYFARCIDRMFPFVKIETRTEPVTASIRDMRRALAMMKSCREDQEARISQM